jgi:hypothetical protein
VRCDSKWFALNPPLFATNYFFLERKTRKKKAHKCTTRTKDLEHERTKNEKRKKDRRTRNEERRAKSEMWNRFKNEEGNMEREMWNRFRNVPAVMRRGWREWEAVAGGRVAKP